ncbi:hypothetical protein [Tropicimonas sp. IMCC6043]|uniref:hypothetical protein n=1 Tax=Tropicimonas sp. IMCC6043 TaxID=2510645 RepID=UPI00101CF462|nr:hypothetical protein [Tropicimonas sp. IMCC6043]
MTPDELEELRHLLALYQEQLLDDDRLIRRYQEVIGITPDVLQSGNDAGSETKPSNATHQRTDLVLLAAPKRYSRPGYVEGLERETRHWTAVALQHPLKPTLWLDLFRLQRRRARRNRNVR